MNIISGFACDRLKVGVVSTLRKGLSLKCFYIPAVQLVCSEALLCMYAYGDGSSEKAYTLTCITAGATIYRRARIFCSVQVGGAGPALRI